MTSSAASALRSYDNRLSYNRIFHATLQQQCYYFDQNFNSLKKTHMSPSQDQRVFSSLIIEHLIMITCISYENIFAISVPKYINIAPF